MADNMQALVNYAAASGSVEMRSASIPTIQSNEVLLEVKAVGVCGSDLHQWHGTHSWPVNYPCTLGHEFGGRIVEVGKDVSSFRVDDRVVSETAAVINTQSPFSRQGLYNLDPTRLGFGYGVDGAMAKYVAVPERCLHNVPDELDLNIAALTEPCCVAYNAVCVNTRIKPGDSVLVLGPGPIGLLCGQMAKLSGAGTVIMAGLPNDAIRLQAATQMGSDITTTENVWETVQSIHDGHGVDVVVDATGASISLKMAMQCVRPAGQITKVGWGPQPLNFNLDPLVQKAVTLQGTFSHNWPTWERIIQMLNSGQLDINPIVSRVAPLNDWLGCFEKMLSGQYVKAVLNP